MKGVLTKGSVRKSIVAALIVFSMGLCSLALANVSSLDPTWTPPVTVASRGTYNSLAISLTETSIYMLSWEYGFWANGGVSLFKSMDKGSTWTKTDVFGMPIKDSHPNMCAYTNPDGTDTVIVASSPGAFGYGTYQSGVVAISRNGGQSFTVVELPYGPPLGGSLPCDHWMYMSVDTNQSWLGAPPDDDVYVFGSRVFGSYYSGLAYVSMTVSHDGGQTWTEPKTVAPFRSFYPEVISDGKSLYLLITSLEDGPDWLELFAMKSDDWGMTWSTPIRIYDKVRQGIVSCSLQYSNENRALFTFADPSVDYPTARGTWGYLNFEPLSFEEKGFVTGYEWNVDFGFAGKQLADGTLALGWIHRNLDDFGSDDVRFTYGTNLGLEPPVPPQPKPSPIELIDRLIGTINSWALPQKTSGSLIAKLLEARGLLEIGNTNGAIHKLGDFISSVWAMSEKKLTREQATFLVGEANHIISVIPAWYR